MKYWLWGIVVVLASTSVTAEEEINCAQIQNARERLACYDQQFPRQPSQPSGTTTAPAAQPAPKPAPKLAEEPLPSAAPATPAQAPVAAPTAPPAAPSAPPAAPSSTTTTPAEAERGGLFDWYEQVDISATIAGLRREDKQKMVFRLDNGQIWLQTSPRDLPIRKGDKVTIKSGKVGGFMLSNEKGVTTRVRRIK